MRKIAPFLVLPILLLMAPALRAQTTLTSPSCGSTDVQNTLNSVSADLTTVVLPSCPSGAIWATHVIYNQVYSTIIQGAGGVTGSDSLGNPTGCNAQTVILDDVTHTGSNPQTLVLNTARGKYLRITGIAFETYSGQSSTPSNGMIEIEGTSHAVRFDHNCLEPSLAGEGLLYLGGVIPVIDHNDFAIQGSVNNNLIEAQGLGWLGQSDAANAGDPSWADVDHFGTQLIPFVENNAFSGSAGHAFDCEEGGRLAFRYNSLGASDGLQSHGTGHDTRGRGCRALEIYGNIANSGGGFAFFMQYESGAAMIFGNTTSGYNSFIEMDDVRTNTGTYCQTATPNGWGFAAASPLSGGPNSCPSVAGSSVWDASGTTTLLDGIGRGAGDLLTGGNGGSFTGTVDSVTSTQTWPNEALTPVYIWGQNVTVTANYVFNYSGDTLTTINRDYYTELPNFSNAAVFNGTAGVGCGPISSSLCTNNVAIPASCTTGVAYWNTQTSATMPIVGALYQCSTGGTPGTWTLLYQPYPHPHPLASGLQSWGNMDLWLPMSSGSTGTNVTPSILSNGAVTDVGTTTWTICSVSGSCNNPTSLPAMTLAASQCGQMGSIVVNGVNYPVGTSEQAIAYNDADNFNYAQTVTVPSGIATAVANGCLIPGWANGGTISGDVGDLVLLNDTASSAAVIMQINNGNGQCGAGIYCLQIEVNGPVGFGRSTSGITLIPGHKYTFSLLFNSSTTVSVNGHTGTAELTVFDAQNNFAIVGQIFHAQDTGTTLASWRFGNAEATTSTGTTYYEDLMLDTSNTIYPNFPQGAGGSVTLSPSSESYGLFNVGASSSPVTFTLTNNSATTATSISVSDTDSTEFVITNSGAGSCASGSLAASASCTFTVTFSPTSAGAKTPTLSVSYSGGDGASPQTAGLSGTGVSVTAPAAAIFGMLR
jgi:hypothetical protein